MDESGFLLAYLPFWVVNFGLAMVGWTCLAIFILTPLTAGKPSPILRGFRFISGWAIAAVRVITPSYVAPPFLPLVAFFWVFAVRYIAALTMLAMGWGPSLTRYATGAP